MFCPLCQAEFRDGFIRCSDCKVGLEATLEKARSSSAMLWTGGTQRTLDAILTALADHNIPAHYKENVNVAPSLTIQGFTIGSTQPTFEYEVRVLLTDLENAKRAIQNVRKV